MELRATRVKKPVDAFPKCPSCLMEHFLSVEGIHVYCGFCSWDSVQAYADAGGYEGKERSEILAALSGSFATSQMKLMRA